MLGTFSIVARCKETDDFGIAVATAVPNVGSLCPYVSRKGAIATQSFVNVNLGVKGLKMLDMGLSVSKALQALLDEDTDREIRQVHGVDKKGNTFAFSGNKCEEWFGHIQADYYTVAGNMLVGEKTIQAMASSFESTEGERLELSERLLRALEAAQSKGGDKRGKQSAALLIASDNPQLYHNLRVDEHVEPVKELRRIYDATIQKKKELEAQYGEEVVELLSRVKH